MSLITRSTAGGLVVAEHAQDEKAVARALRQIDERFTLWPPDAMSPYYRVYCRVSDWQESVCVCTWMDEQGQPLPLSSGLLNEVDRLRLDARNKEIDADTFNRLRSERIAKEKADRGEAIIGEHRAKVERNQTSVSLTDVRRKPEWLKRNRGRLG